MNEEPKCCVAFDRRCMGISYACCNCFVLLSYGMSCNGMPFFAWAVYAFDSITPVSFVLAPHCAESMAELCYVLLGTLGVWKLMVCFLTAYALLGRFISEDNSEEPLFCFCFVFSASLASLAFSVATFWKLDDVSADKSS